MSEFDLDAQLSTLAKYSAVPVARIDYRNVIDEGEIGNVNSGIVMLMAFWSGTAVAAFRTYTGLIARTPLAEQLQLVVGNIDESPALYKSGPFVGNISGSCECVFIQRGQLFDAVFRYDELSFQVALERLICKDDS